MKFFNPRIIFLFSSLTAQLPNASASPINQKEGGVHRRNDASDDEFEGFRKAAEILGELKTSNDQAVATKRRLSQIEKLLEDSDEDSYQISRKNSQSRKRLKLLSESKNPAELKTTGLDVSDDIYLI